MNKSVIFSVSVLFLVGTLFAVVLGSSTPAPAADVSTGSTLPATDSPEVETTTLLACREKSDMQAVLDALKLDYVSARSLADELVTAKKCGFAWELTYSKAENPDLQCEQISETKCYRIVLGKVNVIDENQIEDKHQAYMLLQAADLPSVGPEFSNSERLVWFSML